MNCNKCIHFEMCKYVDCLPKIQEAFPFVEDFTCKFMDKGEKKSKESSLLVTKKETAPIVPKEEPLQSKKEDTSLEEKPKRKRKQKESVEETKAEPKETKKNDSSFTSLSIDGAFGRFSNSNEITKVLKSLGCNTVADIYTVDKSKLDDNIVTNINARLKIFNQPLI